MKDSYEQNKENVRHSAFTPKRRKLTRYEPSQEEKQLVELETKVQTLKRLKRYREKNEGEELEGLICRWRSIAQKAAEALLVYFIEDSKTFLPTQSFWDLDENPQQCDGKDAEEEEKEEDTDDMLRMLSFLHVDHELLHYSTDECSFYD